MTDTMDDAIDHVVSSGLLSASENDIMRQLDAELQQQTQAKALVLSGDEPEPWVLGGEKAGGFGSMAQRFLTFYSDAIYREICDPEKRAVKDQYHMLLGGGELKEQIKSLAPVILGALGISISLVNPAVIAAIVAVWLLRTGLNHWCSLPRPATETAASPGAAPADPVSPAATPQEPTAPIGGEPAPSSGQGQ